jgi:hypothetical protein
LLCVQKTLYDTISFVYLGICPQQWVIKTT